MSFEFGDWVVYDTGYKMEIGRVTECRDDYAFVCYHQGCTAAATPLEHLRPAKRGEIENADKSIGFHRFDESCPEREESACFMCGAKKVEVS